MKNFLTKHKTLILRVALFLLLLLCVYGAVTTVIQVRFAKSVYAECMASIKTHGITQAHLSMTFPPLDVHYTDTDQVVALLETLEDASYFPKIKARVSFNSNMLHVQTNGHDYYFGKSRGCFKISKDGKAYYFFCGKSQEFSIIFAELIDPYESDPSYFIE